MLLTEQAEWNMVTLILLLHLLPWLFNSYGLLGSGASVNMSAPVTISGNEARLAGGAISLDDGATVTLPVDAGISGNIATAVSHTAN